MHHQPHSHLPSAKCIALAQTKMCAQTMGRWDHGHPVAQDSIKGSFDVSVDISTDLRTLGVTLGSAHPGLPPTWKAALVVVVAVALGYLEEKEGVGGGEGEREPERERRLPNPPQPRVQQRPVGCRPRQASRHLESPALRLQGGGNMVIGREIVTKTGTAVR